MYHGVAKAKIDIDSISIKIGDEGIVTAYLPERNIFAVMFSENKWITFNEETEDEFLKKFEIINDHSMSF